MSSERETIRTHVAGQRPLLASWGSSLATRYAFGTVLLIVAVTALVVNELTRLEWVRLMESKRRAATMVAELFAGSLEAAMDFNDQEAVTDRVAGLRSSVEILTAAVSVAGKSEPVAEYRRTGKGECGSADCIEVVQAVFSPTGQQLGHVNLKVSLDRELADFGQARRRLMWLGVLFSLGLATVLIGVARRFLVAPISRLEEAARGLASGAIMEVPVLRDDELGRLSQTFNAMAHTIDERERRIAAQNRRLQNLLDNMGQAIVVFGADGKLTEEHSRQAERIFGATPGQHIMDVLMSHEGLSDMEREAFQVWLHAVFKSGRTQFQELVELAPRTVPLRRQDEQFELDLEFRLVTRETQDDQVMLLATDVTEKRRLERSVEEKDREHEAQLSAVRRLVAGGGQLFAGFIENAHRRLAWCQEALAARPDIDQELIEALFQQFHTMRAEARCFDLSRVEGAIRSLEGVLADLRKSEKDPTGAGRKALVDGVAELGTLLQEAEATFIEQSPLGAAALDQITVRRTRFLALVAAAPQSPEPTRRLIEDLAARPLAESIALLPEAVARWAEKADKSVRLEIDHKGVEIPFSLSRVLGGVLSHLLRNAIAHGIEREAERHAANKSGTGTIRIAAKVADGGVSITVADDGRGFDTRALSVRLHALGKDVTRPLNLAFESGVSTSAERGELAGAGVGLAAARAELASVGYGIQIVATGPQGSELCVSPLIRTNQQPSVRPEWQATERS